MPDPHAAPARPTPPRSTPDDYTGDFTPEEIAAASEPYEGPTYTLEEVLDHARRAAGAERPDRRS